ncbi:XdhC family protein [Kribbella sp. NPDC051620]|uniref:XdhC family protein n=1 Tax=Kribbella sp. NPDC051620 TaxID=3364120 RepID=UPI0037BB11EF
MRTLQQRRLHQQYSEWLVAQNSRDFTALTDRSDDPHRVAGTSLTRTLPNVDASSYVLVMTHNFLRDGEYLAAALAAPAKYIAVLGPRPHATRRLCRTEPRLARLAAPAARPILRFGSTTRSPGHGQRSCRLRTRAAERRW